MKKISLIAVSVFLACNLAYSDMPNSIAGIEVGDTVSKARDQLRHLEGYTLKPFGYGHLDCGVEIEAKYNDGEIELYAFDDKVSYINFTSEIPGTQQEISRAIQNKYGRANDVINHGDRIELYYSSGSLYKRVHIQIFKLPDINGIYTTLSHENLQRIMRENQQCNENLKIEGADSSVIPNV